MNKSEIKLKIKNTADKLKEAHGIPEKVTLMRELNRLRKELESAKDDRAEEWTFIKKGVSFNLKDGSIYELLLINLATAVNLKPEWLEYGGLEQFAIATSEKKRFEQQDENEILKMYRDKPNDSGINPEDFVFTRDHARAQSMISKAIVRIAKVLGEKVPKIIKDVGKAADAFLKDSLREKKNSFKRGYIQDTQRRMEHDIRQKFEYLLAHTDIPVKGTAKMFPEIKGVTNNGQSMTHYEANGKKGNPSFYWDTSDYEVNEKGEHHVVSYDRNCVACSIVYELRRRGYDVSANPMPLDMDDAKFSRLSANSGKKYRFRNCSSDIVIASSKFPQIAFIDPKTNLPPIPQVCTAESPEEGYLWLKSHMIEGARYQFCVDWNTVQSGHAMTAFIDDGEVVVYCPQSGITWRGKDECMREFNHVIWAVNEDIDPDAPFDPDDGKNIHWSRCPYITRMDNLLINEEIIKKLVKPRNGEVIHD